MSSSRLAAALALASVAFEPAASAAVHVNCPASIQVSGAVRKLTDAAVFQGALSEKGELAPVNGSWDLGDIRGTGGGEPFNLVCHYEKAAAVRSFVLPKAVTTCDLTGYNGGTQVSCH